MSPTDTLTFNQAVALAQSGQKADAHAQLVKLARTNPTSVDLLLWIAFTSTQAELARQMIANAERLAPQSPDVLSARQWLTATFPTPIAPPAGEATTSSPAVDLKPIETGGRTFQVSVNALSANYHLQAGNTFQESNSLAFSEELSRELKLWFWVRIGVIAIGVILASMSKSVGPSLSGTFAWAGIIVIGLAVWQIVIPSARLPRSMVLNYKLDNFVDQSYRTFHAAFAHFATAKVWSVTAWQPQFDPKFNAGATGQINRKGGRAGVGKPPHTKTSLPCPFIEASGQNYYFLPDKVLFVAKNQARIIPYSAFQLAIRPIRFVETKSVPRDALIVSRTWDVVNKRGGPDRRYKDNKQHYVCQYQYLSILSNAAPPAYLMVSNVEKVEWLKKHFEYYAAQTALIN